MRVIKFRAWDIEDKKMLYFNGIFNQRPYTEQSCFIQYESCPKYHNLEIMQFIGLLDRNGKEIYEGDILATENNDPKYDLWDKSDHGYTIVQYKDCNVAFSNWHPDFDRDSNESVYGIEFVEVIGNIFENPEKST